MEMELRTPLIPNSMDDSYPPLFHKQQLACPSSESSRLEIPDELLLPKWTDSIINKRPMFHLRPRPAIVDPEASKRMKMDELWIEAEKFLTLCEVEEGSEERSECPVLFQDLALGASPAILRPRAIRQWLPRFQVDDRETNKLEIPLESPLLRKTVTEVRRVV